MVKDQNKFKSISNKLRLKILKIINDTRASHIGSIFSCLDIILYIYIKIIKFKNKSPNHDFILSKGHAGLGLYTCLSYLKIISERKLNTYYKNGSKLSGHVSHHGVEGVEISTGSLGHGLSIGCGLAYGNKLNKNKKKTFVLMSDGECDEGSVWEAALFAAHFNLNNLICVIDYNKIQSLKKVSQTIKLEPFVKKWQSFGWKVIQTDGHNYKSLKNNFAKINKSNKPICIIAHTVKGNGVSFMQNSVLWHYRAPNEKEYFFAKKELENKL